MFELLCRDPTKERGTNLLHNYCICCLQITICPATVDPFHCTSLFHIYDMLGGWNRPVLRRYKSFWNGMPFLQQPHSLFEQVAFTSSMDHASVQMNDAQDQVFKETLARCLCTVHSGSHRSIEVDFGGQVQSDPCQGIWCGSTLKDILEAPLLLHSCPLELAVQMRH